MAYADNTTGGRIVEGMSVSEVKITLADGTTVDPVLPGDLLGISSATWVRALATAGSVVPPFLVAGQKGISGDVIQAYPEAIVRGVSGAAVGTYVYTAEGAAYGQTTQTAPSSGSDLNAPVGFAIAADTIYLCPGTNAGMVYSDTDHLHA